MRHRQLIDDVGSERMLGFMHYSQSNQKLALVGTLARVKDRKLMADGRSFVVVEGVRRFYIKECITEKPYLKARVQAFEDWCEDESQMLRLEERVFREVRANLKVSIIHHATLVLNHHERINIDCQIIHVIDC